MQMQSPTPTQPHTQSTKQGDATVPAQSSKKTGKLKRSRMEAGLEQKQSNGTQPSTHNQATDAQPMSKRAKKKARMVASAAGAASAGGAVGPSPAVAPAPPPSSSSTHSGLSALQQKMSAKLAGAHFRWLNEKLYTCSSSDAWEFFQSHPEEFRSYHDGFNVQAQEWPLSPLDECIQFVNKKPNKYVIGDFGCGEARLSASVPHTVHSFDLVAVNDRVTPCNIAHVPLQPNTLDVAIFCLSLMGTDYFQFIKEAKRTLKSGGTLLICEVRSRFETSDDKSGLDAFITSVCKLGFQLRRKDTRNKMFATLEFHKNGAEKVSADDSKRKQNQQQTQTLILKEDEEKKDKGGAQGSNKKTKSKKKSKQQQSSQQHPSQRPSKTQPNGKQRQSADSKGDTKAPGKGKGSNQSTHQHASNSTSSHVSAPILAPCIYKKR